MAGSTCGTPGSWAGASPTATCRTTKAPEGKALGEPPEPVNDDAVREPRVLEALAQSP